VSFPHWSKRRHVPIISHTGSTSPEIYQDLSTNNFVWTPGFQEGSRLRPTTEGDETNFRPKYEAGDSVYVNIEWLKLTTRTWSFTEMQDGWNTPGVESNVYISGNITIMSLEDAEKQDPKYVKHNGISSKAR
jgi:hypothetical protein